MPDAPADTPADALLAVVRLLSPARQQAVLDFAAFLRAQEEVGDGAPPEAPTASDDARDAPPRRANLHPGAMVMRDDFDDSLQFEDAHDATRPRAVPNLHPGAMVVRDDFDDPLPDGFWFGEDVADGADGEGDAS